MKKLAVLLAMIAVSTGVKAQSLVVAEMDTIVEVNSTYAADYSFHINLANTSAYDLDVIAERAYSSASCANDSGYFCWDYCYGATTNVSIGTVPITAGDTSNSFSGHVYSSTTGATCTDSVRYVFYDEKNTSDSVSAWVFIQAGPNVGTVEISVKPIEVYPNPAANTLYVDAQESGTLFIYNTLGSVVMAKPISEGKNTIDISHLSAGAYLYRLNNGEVKRLMVNN